MFILKTHFRNGIVANMSVSLFSLLGMSGIGGKLKILEENGRQEEYICGRYECCGCFSCVATTAAFPF